MSVAHNIAAHNVKLYDIEWKISSYIKNEGHIWIMSVFR